ncbi:MAG: hypothetical protein V7K41_26535 [Nostoc sp.]|uniref:hypothetical protein n=1 Tax=Nostoc sp. TaxID=1180 RepID=UPI002FF99A37
MTLFVIICNNIKDLENLSVEISYSSSRLDAKYGRVTALLMRINLELGRIEFAAIQTFALGVPVGAASRREG